MKKTIAMLTAISMLLVALAGCGGTSGGAAGNGGNSETGDSSITMALDTNPTSLDPYKQFSGSDMLINQIIFEGLLYFPTGSTEPTMMLAEDYEISEDGTLYTFHIRQGVKFHNGADLTADDVVYSVKRAQTATSNTEWVLKIQECVAVDEYTVTMQLADVFPAFLSYFDALYITDEETTEAAGDTFGEHPVGTGPYQFVSMVSNDQVVLEAYEGYWGGKPDIDNVTLKVMTEPSTNVMALQTGEIDTSYLLPASSYAELSASEDVTLTSKPVNCIEFAYFNSEVEPFDNKLVRKAISYAVDRELISQICYEGYGMVANNFITPSAFGYSENVTGLEYDMDKAKELMVEAGYADGVPGTFTISCTAGKNSSMAEVLMAGMQELGFDVKIETLETAAVLQQQETGNYQIGISSVGPATTDASAYDDFFREGGTKNYLRYVDEQVVAWFDEAQSTIDEEARLELYEKIGQRINDEALYCPLTYRVTIYAYNNRLDNSAQYDGWSRSGYPLPQYMSLK